MTRTVTIAPVRKTILVEASQSQAFEVFTVGIGRWWPASRGIGKEPRVGRAIEPRVGGRWFETAEDGTETTVGHILVWEPPQRFVVTWEVSAKWQPDPGNGSEVEVCFFAEGPNATRVELEHRKFERMGIEAGESIRKDVDGGWPYFLDLFKAEVELNRQA
jgi:uncharacterized protein YndB with AHSA1/START domain